MSLTLEDGTGVAGANSYITSANAATFLTVRAIAFTGSTAALEAALAKAFDYLANEKRYRYRGSRTTATQRAPWPRTGATELSGPTYASNAIPWRVIDAQCFLAAIALAGAVLEPALDRGGAIASESIGPISTSYMPSAPSETVFKSVEGLLEPLLWNNLWRNSTPYITEPVDAAEYTTGNYLNEGGTGVVS